MRESTELRGKVRRALDWIGPGQPERSAAKRNADDDLSVIDDLAFFERPTYQHKDNRIEQLRSYFIRCLETAFEKDGSRPAVLSEHHFAICRELLDGKQELIVQDLPPSYSGRLTDNEKRRLRQERSSRLDQIADIVVKEETRNRNLRSHTSTSAVRQLLGLCDGQRTPIVIPTFEMEELRMKMAQPREVGAYSPKWYDVHRLAHARHDVLAAFDIASTLLNPTLVTARKWISQLDHWEPEEGEMRFGSYPVSQFVVIGMFSNLATRRLFCSRDSTSALMALNQLGDDPSGKPVPEAVLPDWRAAPLAIVDPIEDESLQMAEGEQAQRQRAIVVRKPSGEISRVFRADEARIAVFCRLTFAEARLTIVGGFDALGTVRITDYLTLHDALVQNHRSSQSVRNAWHDEVLDAQQSDSDLLMLLRTPGENDRFQASEYDVLEYSTWTPRFAPSLRTLSRSQSGT